MTQLTAESAYKLLIKGVINKEEDFAKPENRWIKHCIKVGIAAQRIAKKLGLNDDYAKSLGYVHDIGRKISHVNHPINGYYYMIKEGYPNEVRSCITHSFIDNDISLTAGALPDEKAASFFQNYLSTITLNDYDNIIQLCDLFCEDSGFTTIEKRILDISKRKGIYPHSKKHFIKALELKERIEKRLGCSLYDLFPEIPKETLESIDLDREELLNILDNNSPKLTM